MLTAAETTARSPHGSDCDCAACDDARWECVIAERTATTIAAWLESRAGDYGKAGLVLHVARLCSDIRRGAWRGLPKGASNG